MLDRLIYKASLVLALAVLTAAGAAAQNQITGIQLNRSGDYTLVSIFSDGPMRIAHQSVEAKDGKPFRIVIDCLAVRHALPQNTFNDLPRTAVTSIRTSQYSVKPEEVVRVVLDLRNDAIYRVETQGQVARIHINDPNSASFDNWLRGQTSAVDQAINPQAVPAKVTIEEDIAPVVAEIMNEPEQQQDTDDNETMFVSDGKPVPLQYKQAYQAAKQKSQDNKPVQTEARVPSVVKRQLDQKPAVQPQAKPEPALVKLPVPQESINYGPQMPQPEKIMAQAPVAKPKPQEKPVESKQIPEIASKTEKAPEKPITTVANEKAQSEIKKADKPQQLATVNQPKPQPVASTKKPQPPQPMMAKTAVQPDSKPVVYGPFPPAGYKPPVEIAKAKKDQAPVMASADVKQDQPPVPGRLPGMPGKENQKQPPQMAQADSKDAKSDSRMETTTSTSRYRRTAAKSQRMKQTQVVQFPQRMVIKYNSGTDRDPFKNLISNSKLSGVRSHGGNLDKPPNVEALRLVGILKSVAGKSAALMEDMEGIGYILKPGDRIQKGYLAQITDNSAYFQVNEYGWTRTVTKELEIE